MLILVVPLLNYLVCPCPTRSEALMEAEALLSEKDEALLAAYESLTTACRERAGLRAQLLRVGAGCGWMQHAQIAHRWACASPCRGRSGLC